MRHTPGPWRVSSKSKYLVRTDDFRVCQVFKSNSNPSLNEAAMADAQLISAAPELLQALKCALADLEGSLQAHEQGDCHSHDWKAHQLSIEESRAAIAKATGDKE